MTYTTHQSKDKVIFNFGSSFNVKEGSVSLGNESGDEIAEAIEPEEIRLGYREATPQLQISMTDACNMSCSYCSFRKRIGQDGKPVNMPVETANKAIEYFRKYLSEDFPYARIDFGLAGEPMLRRDTHDSLMRKIRESFQDSGMKAVWAGPNVTNGTLAKDNQIAESLGAPQDISCDGPKEVHDEFRKYANGEGTYDDLEKLIRTVLKRQPDIGGSAVLTAKYPNFDEIFLHLYEVLGFRNIYMKPVNVSPDVEYGLNSATLPKFIKGYTRFVNLIMTQPKDKMLDYLLSLSPESFFMRFFYRVKDRTKQLYRCGAGKSGAYVDTNGKLYPCAHFIGKTGWDIGSLDEGINEQKKQEYIELHVDTREPCQSCWARYLCGGGCYYQAVLANGDIRKPDSSLCELILHLSSEAIRLFTYLATQAPEVLSALPNPYYIPQEELNVAPDASYFPASALKAVEEKQSSLIPFSAVQGAILNEGSSAGLRLNQRNHQLEISLRWDKKTHVKDIRLWFTDLENSPIKVGELSVVNSELHGVLLMLDKDGGLCRHVTQLNRPVRKIPYEKTEWELEPHKGYQRDSNNITLTLDLKTVFRTQTVPKLYGFNAFLDLAPKGLISLVRFEPFCSVDSTETGYLQLENRFSSEACLPQSNDESPLNVFSNARMEPLGRWQGVYGNVC